MAMSIRRLCRLNASLTNSCLKLFKPNFVNVGVRFMYSEQDIGIPNFESAKFSLSSQFIQVENTFREKMKEICQSDSGVIYMEDLKAMIHLVQANDDDMGLLNNMLRKYIANQKDGFGTYRFGPVLMRMYYYLDQPKHAIESFMNPDFHETYNYHVVHRILLSLLYKHEMYKEIRNIFELLLAEKGAEFIGSSFIVIYAICLRENTPESLQYAMKYWQCNQNSVPGPRSRAIVATLALKQNSPELALNILNSGPVDQVISIRSLKVLTFMKLNRFIQIIPILKRAVDNENPYYQAIFSDTLSILEDKMKDGGIPEANTILSLIEDMKRKNFVQSSMTLEEFILKPLVMKSTIDKMRETNRRNRMRRFSNRDMLNRRPVGLRTVT